MRPCVVEQVASLGGNAHVLLKEILFGKVGSRCGRWLLSCPRLPTPVVPRYAGESLCLLLDDL